MKQNREEISFSKYGYQENGEIKALVDGRGIRPNHTSKMSRQNVCCFCAILHFHFFHCDNAKFPLHHQQKTTMNSIDIVTIADQVLSYKLYPDLMEESSLSAFDDDEYSEDDDMMLMDDFVTSFSTPVEELAQMMPAPVTPPHTSFPASYEEKTIEFQVASPALVSPESCSRTMYEGENFPSAPATTILKTPIELEELYKEGIRKLRTTMKKSEVTRTEILRQRQVLGYKLNSDLRGEHSACRGD